MGTGKWELSLFSLGEIRTRTDRLDAMTIPLAAEAEIASRQALAILARTIEAFDLALEQNRRILTLTEDRPHEDQARAEALRQIGWIHVQRREGPEALEAMRHAEQLNHVNGDPHRLNMTHVHLMEALLLVGDVDAARATLRQKELPSGPHRVTFEALIADLESRYETTLMPQEP